MHEISRYLNGLELMQIPKPLREDLGGGTKEFTVKDVSEIPKRRQTSTFPVANHQCILQASEFEGIEEPSRFLTSQERQAVILYLIESLRAEKGDSVGKVKFREGEAIGGMPTHLFKAVFHLHFAILFSSTRP